VLGEAGIVGECRESLARRDRAWGVHSGGTADPVE
jgi:hypothetical protein